MRDLMMIVESVGTDDMEQEELRRIAQSVRGDNDDGSPAYFDPNEGHWRVESEFPLAGFTTIMSADEWKSWIAGEIEMFTDELGHDRGYTAMMSEAIEEEVVVSIYNGAVHIWDGFHRVGVSFAKGAKTIKAIVGEPAPVRKPTHLRDINRPLWVTNGSAACGNRPGRPSPRGYRLLYLQAPAWPWMARRRRIVAATA
jgi:hypothetical protein